MNVQTAVEQFLLAGGADGLKEKTLIWYTSMLKPYVEQYGARGLKTITPSDVRAYLVKLRARSYSDDTLHGLTRSLHRLWRWCAHEYGLPNPMINIAYPKQPKPKQPKAVAITDVIRMLDVCGNSVIGRRDKAILAFLTDTGCRAAGLCGLTMPDLDMDRMRAYVVEKGSKRRVVMFTETTALLLHQWLFVRNPAPSVLNVFHNHRGKPLTIWGLYQLTERLRDRAGVTGRTNPHAFRHGFAIQYLLDGGDLATLSRILGHESTEVTSRFYAVFVDEQLVEMHRAHSPMRKIHNLS